MGQASNRFSLVVPRSAHDVRKRRLRAIVLDIDALLFDLEELNLRGQDRVPAALRERAVRLLELVPNPRDPDYRVRWRVAAMMDVLFRAQELVFQSLDPDRPEDEELGA